MWKAIALLSLLLHVWSWSPVVQADPNVVKLAETSIGDLHFVGNELIVRSKIADPSKVRLQAPPTSLVKGTISFDTLRSDGRAEEIAFILGKQDERYRANPSDYTGQIDFGVRRYIPGTPDDPQMRKIVEAMWDRWGFHVPTTGAVSVPAPPPPISPFELRSPDGRFIVVIQDDGNVVAYDRQTGQAKLILSMVLGDM